MEGNCDACSEYGIMDRAHVKSKGSGGTWDEDNILTLCRTCHIAQHKAGWRVFSEKRPRVMRMLESKGWEFIEEFGRSKLVRK